MKKGLNEDYKEYAIRWKNVASMVRPPLTSREENSMFVDTLASLYYDMLVVHVLMEFGDLMYYLGRIEDGIKRGKITDIRASMMEKKRIILDKHVQTVFRERGSKKRSHITRDEPAKNHPRSSMYAQVPLINLHSPQRFARERGQKSNSSYPRGNKRKRTKMYHALPMSYRELLPILIQNYEISLILARPRRPPYPERYDIKAKYEYHRGVGGHSMKDCMIFKDKVQALVDADPKKFKELVSGH